MPGLVRAALRVGTSAPPPVLRTTPVQRGRLATTSSANGAQQVFAGNRFAIVATTEAEKGELANAVLAHGGEVVPYKKKGLRAECIVLGLLGEGIDAAVIDTFHDDDLCWHPEANSVLRVYANHRLQNGVVLEPRKSGPSVVGANWVIRATRDGDFKPCNITARMRGEPPTTTRSRVIQVPGRGAMTETTTIPAPATHAFLTRSQLLSNNWGLQSRPARTGPCRFAEQQRLLRLLIDPPACQVRTELLDADSDVDMSDAESDDSDSLGSWAGQNRSSAGSAVAPELHPEDLAERLEHLAAQRQADERPCQPQTQAQHVSIAEIVNPPDQLNLFLEGLKDRSARRLRRTLNDLRKALARLDDSPAAHNAKKAAKHVVKGLLQLCIRAVERLLVQLPKICSAAVEAGIGLSEGGAVAIKAGLSVNQAAGRAIFVGGKAGGSAVWEGGLAIGSAAITVTTTAVPMLGTGLLDIGAAGLSAAQATCTTAATMGRYAMPKIGQGATAGAQVTAYAAKGLWRGAMLGGPVVARTGWLLGTKAVSVSIRLLLAAYRGATAVFRFMKAEWSAFRGPGEKGILPLFAGISARHQPVPVSSLPEGDFGTTSVSAPPRSMAWASHPSFGTSADDHVASFAELAFGRDLPAPSASALSPVPTGNGHEGYRGPVDWPRRFMSGRWWVPLDLVLDEMSGSEHEVVVEWLNPDMMRMMLGA